MEKSSGQIQQIEKANTVIQTQINYPSDVKSKTGIVEAPKPKVETVKTEEQNNKAETIPTRERETQKIVLLPESAEITELNISNDLLDQIYGKAHSQVISKYNDAQLSDFSIQVWPFNAVSAIVNIYMRFYSKFADKSCLFVFSDEEPQVKHAPPDRPVTSDYDRGVFTTLPWNKSPLWLQFLKRVYAKVGPFARASGTVYHLFALPRQKGGVLWTLNFDDHFSGRQYSSEWNGRELDDNSIRVD